MIGENGLLSSLASASIFQHQSAGLNENYWPNDGIEYRTCGRCGATEQCSRGAAPRLCADCDDPELMGAYAPGSYGWLFEERVA